MPSINHSDAPSESMVEEVRSGLFLSLDGPEVREYNFNYQYEYVLRCNENISPHCLCSVTRMEILWK
jgi:hypothetical protein